MHTIGVEQNQYVYIYGVLMKQRNGFGNCNVMQKSQILNQRVETWEQVALMCTWECSWWHWQMGPPGVACPSYWWELAGHPSTVRIQPWPLQWKPSTICKTKYMYVTHVQFLGLQLSWSILVMSFIWAISWSCKVLISFLIMCIS